MSVTGDMLREAMRHVPSPVTVVTACGREEARGVTIGSFISISLEPPLVSINVNREAQMRDVLATTDRFAVHVLRAEQAALSERFAVPDMEAAAQFEDVAYHVEDGIPILEDVLAVLYCRREELHEAGTHSVFVGRVERIEEHGGAPLIYYRSAYYGVGAEAGPSRLEPVKRSSSATP